MDHVVMDDNCFCVYVDTVDPSVLRVAQCKQHDAVALLSAYTVTYFIAREKNKRKSVGECAFILDYFSLPKGQDGCHLSSPASAQICFSRHVP